jgi:hypothetical protein
MARLGKVNPPPKAATRNANVPPGRIKASARSVPVAIARAVIVPLATGLPATVPPAKVAAAVPPAPAAVAVPLAAKTD